MAHGEGRRGPARPAHPRPSRRCRSLRTPRAGPHKRCYGRCGHGQHDALHPQGFSRQEAFLHGHVCFYGGAVAAVGASGPAWYLVNSWACWLHDVIAVSIHSTTASHGRRDDMPGTKGAEADARGLADGRAQPWLEAYLRIINALPRAYRPRCPPPPALSISNSPWASGEARKSRKGLRHGASSNDVPM